VIQAWPSSERFLLKDGRVLEGDLHDPLFRSLYLYGEYEPVTTAALAQLVRTGDTVVDVGANVGILTALFGRLVGRTGRVFAFEPVTAQFEILKRTISLNDLGDVVVARNQAVGEQEREKVIIYVPQGHSHACSSLRVEDPALAEVCVSSMVTLERALPRRVAPTLVKVDVEGAEMSVLVGGQAWHLCRQPPIWVLEVNRAAASLFDYAPEDLVAFLKAHGYHQFFWSDHRCLHDLGSTIKLPTVGHLYALPEWAIEEGRTLKALSQSS